MQQRQLQAVMAHEIGHAKHHHILKFSGMITIAQKVISISITHLLGRGTFPAFLTITLIYLSANAISRENEYEADSETVPRYKEGAIKFFKKLSASPLPHNITEKEKTLFEKLRAIKWRSSHPSSLQRILSLQNQKRAPSKTSLLSLENLFVAVGSYSLLQKCSIHAIRILKYYR